MATKDIFVIDFNSKQISFCWAECNNQNLVNIKKLIQKDYAGFVDGDFLDKEEIGSLLRTGLAELNVKYSKINNLYIGVPAHFSNVVCKNVTKNFIEPKKITETDIYSLFDNAENFEHLNQTVINRSGLNYILDNTISTENPLGKIASCISANVSIVVADNHFIKTVSTNLPVLNITSPQFVSNQLCQTLHLLTQAQRQNNAIIIDFGYINSSVTFVSGDGIKAIRSFSIGGGHIIGDLSQVLKVTFNSAEKLCNSISLDINNAKTININVETKDGDRPVSLEYCQEIVKARLEVITGLISKCITSMQAVIPSYSPIYLTGESLNQVNGIKSYISKALNKNVEVLKPKVPKYDSSEFCSLISVIDMGNQEEQYKPKTFWQKVLGI